MLTSWLWISWPHDPRRGRDPLAARHRLPRQGDVRDEQILIDAVFSHGHGDEGRAGGKPHALVARPADALEVTHEVDLAAREVRFLEDGLRDLERRPVAGRAGAHDQGVDGTPQARRVGRRASQHARTLGERHHGRPVERAQPVDDPTGLVARLIQMVADLHAVGLVHEHHHFARTAGGADAHLAAVHERTGEGDGHQGEGERTEREQEPVLDPPPSLFLIGDLLQEHERREMHHVPALTAREVHDDRHRDTGDAEQEERYEEAHLALLIRSRASRYWNSARSSGFDVSSSV
jgi:hypothetical protein